MSWMELREYSVIGAAARDRLGVLRRAAARRGMKAVEAPTSMLATVLSAASALRSQPRAIDRYIDYFGDQAFQR